MALTVAFTGGATVTQFHRPRRRARCARRSLVPSARAVPPSPAPTPSAHLAVLAEKARGLKCPFFRRRSTDAIEAIAATLAWVATVRHKSLPLEAVVRGGGALAPSRRERAKRTGLGVAELARIVESDFVKRQYYVTGRLSEDIYREDCVFDGPDPDVPVRGLAKYCDATKGLFFRPASKVELLEIGVVDARCVKAWWRLEGKLNLPWKPKIKAYTGSTTYFFDEEGLVERHEETWAISASDAFTSTLFPNLGFGAPEAPSAELLRNERKSFGTDFDAYATSRTHQSVSNPALGASEEVDVCFEAPHVSDHLH